ncbi:MAG TPA: BolA family protein [Caulobacterales bacterium]|nr:BolA family protein [Caulobacterales bacterium]
MSNDPRANKELTANKTAPAAISSRAERIAAKLNALFAPAALEVADESAKHEGHAGARPGGETHFRIEMESARFRGLNRVARQRLVNEALKAEFDAGLHALSLKLKAPGEG